ncbi:Pyrimidine monooxygenase RutA [Escherichia coli]|nr:Pyrimidine monooxygenase RutA [Escherichia coli]
MKIGVFVPIGNNGWLISTHAPQYMPTFELNKAIVQKAEHYHFDFALSMIKLRGFGGKTEFWDHNLESFTLMAGLAAVAHSDIRDSCHLNVTSGNRRPYGRNHRLHLWRAFWRQPRDWLAEARV